MGQIAMARYQRSPHLLYALVMPKIHPFPQETEKIDASDLHYLRLHWNPGRRQATPPHRLRGADRMPLWIDLRMPETAGNLFFFENSEASLHLPYTK